MREYYFRNYNFLFAGGSHIELRACVVRSKAGQGSQFFIDADYVFQIPLSADERLKRRDF